MVIAAANNFSNVPVYYQSGIEHQTDQLDSVAKLHYCHTAFCRNPVTLKSSSEIGLLSF